MGSGAGRSLLPALLPLLLLLLPAVWGHCGPLPNISHAEPPEDVKHQGSFSVGSSVTYRCLSGYVKRPLLSDTIKCLETSQWSDLPEFCGRSCPSPPRVPFARISPQDGMQNFYPVNITVKYTCRQGYENTTDQLPTSTCLHNYKWSEIPELCRRKSCGVPANPEHGQVTANDHLFGAQAEVVCNRGYVLKGASSLILCSKRGDGVAWSQLPACQALSCPPPPAIPDGKHDGTDTEEFTYNMVVTYTCNPGLQLVGNETLRCTTENGIRGVWSGSAPECRVSTTMVVVQPGTTVEKEAENPSQLASILVPICIVLLVALAIIAGIIMRWKHSKTHSYNTRIWMHEMKGRDPPMPPKVTPVEKQPRPWNIYFCHTTSCHVCPTCEEQLHTALVPHAKPEHHGCPACEEWLSSWPGTPHTYSVPSIGDGESQSLAGMSSPGKAADVQRGECAGEAVPERSEAEQPMDYRSNHHICPVCESWLRAHLGQCDSPPVAHEERPDQAGPCQQDQGPQGPICPPCVDRLQLSLVHSNTVSCPVCPLARKGTLAHLVPCCTPGCHICPVCTAPTHAHLCQAPDGGVLHGGHPEHPLATMATARGRKGPSS